MNEKEKIKLLGKLYKKYGSVKNIFRLEGDKHEGDSDLETIDFEEWKNFTLWGEREDLFFEFSNSFNCKYNHICLKDSVGLFLENEEEIGNERIRIENERLRLLGEALDRNERDISSISGVPCGLLHPNNTITYEGDVTVNNTRIQGDKNEVNNGGDATVNSTMIQGDKNKVNNGSDSKENKRNFWKKHWKWIIATLVAVVGIIFAL